MILLPFLLTFLTGWLFIKLLFHQAKTLDGPTHVFLSWPLGAGLQAALLFLALTLGGQFHLGVSRALQISLPILLLAIGYFRFGRNFLTWRPLDRLTVSDMLSLGALGGLAFLLWRQAHIYPFGGWDAWGVWNLKAKFIFLGEENWQNMLRPEMWRSSPHYPLLLPLINVAGWSFIPHLDYRLPLGVALAFSLSTAGLLWAVLRQGTRHPLSVLPALLIFLLPSTATLATSQYADVAIAFYLLATGALLFPALNATRGPSALLAGICLGILSFCKAEGLLAVVLMGLIVTGQAVLTFKTPIDRNYFLKWWALGLFWGLLPFLIFKGVFAPENQTFINGLTSTTKPSDFSRLKVIFMFLWAEGLSTKWLGLWFLTLGAFLIAGRQAFRGAWGWCLLFLGSYLGVILAYYWINTYFEIAWWMSVSLSRILFSLLPLTWACLGLSLAHQPSPKTEPF